MLTYKKQSLHKIRNFSSINAYSPSQNKEDNIYKNFDFTITKVDSSSKARLSTINTPHGKVECPNFVFCGTKAAMKAVTTQQLRDEGSQIMLSNTYHLLLTPGPDIVEKLGGLQKMTNWNGPMLTDSGGYQIFSMGFGSVSNEIKGNRDTASLGWNQSLISINEEGATFRSYIDGTIHKLTPESSIQCQKKLGADLVVVLDECTPFNVDKNYTEASMHRSHRWAERSLSEFQRLGCMGKQALYGIVQGGVYEDLRIQSCEYINNMSVFGIAIGGSLGASREDMHEIVRFTRASLRDDKPVHLLGIGGIRDVFHGVRLGIDTFDCVHPTRLARHAGALVRAHHWYEAPPEDAPPNPMELARIDKRRRKEEMRLRQKRAGQGSALEEIFEEVSSPLPNREREQRRVVREHIHLDKASMRGDSRPIDASCDCYTCRSGYSRGYLHHLFKAKELSGATLVTIHNIHFMNRLMADIRNGISQNNLDEVQRTYIHPDLLS